MAELPGPAVGPAPDISPNLRERVQLQVPRYQDSSIGQGIAKFGQDVSQTGNILQAKQDQDTAIRVIQADSYQKTQLLAAKQSLTDGNYDTYGQRFDDAAKQINDNAAALIPDGHAKQNFLARAPMDTAEMRYGVMQNANSMDQQAKQSTLEDSLLGHQKIYADPTSDDATRTQAMADINANIQLSLHTGIITPEKAHDLSITYGDGALGERATVQAGVQPNQFLQQTHQGFQDLASSESGGRYNVMESHGLGPAGKYQFTATRLMDIGDYTPGPNENVSGTQAWTRSPNKWSGTFNIPGFEDVKTLGQFLSNGPAQEAAFSNHVTKMDQEITSNGLDKYEGNTVGGVPITKDGLYNMIHLHGAEGTARTLASGGADNPPDANGTTPLDYAAMGAKSNPYSSLDPLFVAKLRDQAQRQINIGANEQLKAQKAASDQAANSYVSQMLTGQIPSPATIAADKNLTWETKRSLGNMALAKSGSDVQQSSQQYGSGYWDAFKAVTAPAGDPNRVADVNQLYDRAGPGGDLTVNGAQKLAGIMKQNQSSVNDASVNTSKVGLMNYAKSQLSFEQDTGPIKIRDPKGEAIFNSTFIPKFEAAYDEWTKAGKNPWEFLTKDNVDGMMQGLRPKSDMAQDRMSALGDEGVATPEVPVPPAPKGTDPTAWSSVFADRPKVEVGGGIYPADKWGQVVDLLRTNPTPQNIALFNQSQLAQRTGLRGEDILNKLNGVQPDNSGGDKVSDKTLSDLVTGK